MLEISPLDATEMILLCQTISSITKLSNYGPYNYSAIMNPNSGFCPSLMDAIKLALYRINYKRHIKNTTDDRSGQ